MTQQRYNEIIKRMNDTAYAGASALKIAGNRVTAIRWIRNRTSCTYSEAIEIYNII